MKLVMLWKWRTQDGSGDIYEAAFRGSKSRVEIRQTNAEPGLSLAESDQDIRVIPPKLRVGHQADSAQVTSRFFDFVRSLDSMPGWENAGMLARYYVSTTAVASSLAGRSYQ